MQTKKKKNSLEPDQTPKFGIWSGSTLFANIRF